MILHVTVDTGDRSASQAVDLLGHAVAETLKLGHTGSLYTSTDPGTDPHAGFGAGFAKGFHDGYCRGRADDNVLVPALPLRAVQTGEQAVIPFPAPSTITGLPPAVATPPGSSDWPTLAPDQDNTRTTTMPKYTDRPAPMPMPTGERPRPDIGAPLSAYDCLGAGTAHDSFNFPEFPSDGRAITDSEGAVWSYFGEINQWERQTYPLQWAPATSSNGAGFHAER